MMKSSIGVLFSVVMLTSGTAYAAGGCAKTLMGNDCSKAGAGVASHMRGDAVANAKAAKALKAAQADAKKKAKEIAMKK